MALPKEKKKALLAGDRHYFTGRPCKKGHFSKRYSSTGGCVECLASIGKTEESRIYKHRHYLSNRSEHHARGKQWAAENRERSRAIKIRWEQANPEKKKEIACRSARKNYAKNPDKVKARSREYRKKYPEEIAARLHNWRAKNADKVAQHDEVRRQRELNSGGRLTAADVREIMKRQKGRCASCGQKAKLHLDHIMPLALGGSGDRRNFQGLCPHCNGSKHAKHPIDFNRSRGLLL